MERQHFAGSLPSSPLSLERTAADEPINPRLSLLSGHSRTNSPAISPRNSWQPPDGVIIPNDKLYHLINLLDVSKEQVLLWMGILHSHSSKDINRNKDASPIHSSWQLKPISSQRNSLLQSSPRSSLSLSDRSRWSSSSMASSATSYSLASNIELPSIPYSNSAIPSLDTPISNTNDINSTQTLQKRIRRQEMASSGTAKYFCTFGCMKDSLPKSFMKKSDWKSHEAQFHDHQEEYTCKNCELPPFYVAKRFTSHHASAHDCKPCPHAVECRTTLPSKRAWGCGFCSQYLSTWDKRINHVEGHFLAGLSMKDWKHRHVVAGLLGQPFTMQTWVSRLGMWTRNLGREFSLDWSEEETKDLLNKLAYKGEESADDLVSEALRLATHMDTDANDMDMAEDSLALPIQSHSLAAVAEVSSPQFPIRSPKASIPNGTSIIEPDGFDWDLYPATATMHLNRSHVFNVPHEFDDDLRMLD